MPNQEAARKIRRGDLEIAVCHTCGFIFNQAFDLSKLNYGEAYDNTQTWSPFFQDHIDDLINYLIYEKGIKNSTIVEVGCGKGTFLRKLVESEKVGNRGFGFDPSYVGPDTDLDGRLTFFREFYEPKFAKITADVVICRHVVEHIHNPINLLQTTRNTVGSSPHARVFFETPDVTWILQNHVIWDFFYEHCSYFSAKSLQTAFEIAHFQVENVKHVFGGQYLWLEATVPQTAQNLTKDSSSIPALAKRFGEQEKSLIAALHARLQILTKQGSVALWGAGAKGVTLANLIDPDHQWITCIVDINPAKKGQYLPGTGHPIVTPQEIGQYGIDTAILMNPNYYNENFAWIQDLNLQVKLIDLTDWIEQS